MRKIRDWDVLFLQKCLVCVKDDRAILDSYGIFLEVRGYQIDHAITLDESHIEIRAVTEACQRIMGSGWKGKRNYEDRNLIMRRRSVTLWSRWIFDIYRYVPDYGEKYAV